MLLFTEHNGDVSPENVFFIYLYITVSFFMVHSMASSLNPPDECRLPTFYRVFTHYLINGTIFGRGGGGY
jgi:hypothetical protein